MKSENGVIVRGAFALCFFLVLLVSFLFSSVVPFLYVMAAVLAIVAVAFVAEGLVQKAYLKSISGAVLIVPAILCALL